MALTPEQTTAAYEAGMDDAQQTDHTGEEHRLDNPRWVWTRVFGSAGAEPSEEDRTEALESYKAGSADYW